MRKYILFSVLLLFMCAGPAHAQFFGVKTNTLHLATGTLNAGVEVSVAKQWSVEVSGYWNPIRTDRLSTRFFYVQPSARYWLYEHFVGHFVAGHPAYGGYEIGNDRWRYKGWFTGFGVSYGYTWILTRQWNLTAEGGVGLYHMRDRKRWLDEDDWRPEIIKHYRRTVLAPSKLEVSLTYLF